MFFEKARKMQNMSIWRSKNNQNVIFFGCKHFSKSDMSKNFQFEIYGFVLFLIQNLTPCENFTSKSDRFQNFFSKIWVLSCSSGSDWMMISSVNVITNLFQRGELKVIACSRVSRQMDNWKLPHVKASLNVRGKALSQHTIFTGVTNRTLWSIKCSRSAVFLRTHLCQIIRRRSLNRIPSISSNVFVWATKRRAIESSWHLHSIYPILAAGHYLPQSWHSSKLTMPNRKSNFKTCVAQNILWLQSGPINCICKAYFDA